MKVLINVFCMALVLICSVLIWSAAFAQDRIKLTNGEWAPYLSKNQPHFGAASHIVREAFSAVGVEVEYGFFPWKRSYRLAQKGAWNGTLVWVYTPERAKDFLYSDVVIKDQEYLFHLKSRVLKWQEIADLQGLTIGVTPHTVYHPWKKLLRTVFYALNAPVTTTICTGAF